MNQDKTSTIDNLGLKSTRDPPSIDDRTKKCLKDIRNLPSDKPAQIVVLIGRTSTGKSSFPEYCIDAKGHSKYEQTSGILLFQIEEVKTPSDQLYIINIPGFDSDIELEVFRKTVKGIEEVCDESQDKRVVSLVEKLCGLGYAPQITSITTFWNVSEEDEKAQCNSKFANRLAQFQSILGEEIKHYKHGRQYDPSGEDTGGWLMWRGDAKSVKEYARAMLHRHHSGIDLKNPRSSRRWKSKHHSNRLK